MGQSTPTTTDALDTFRHRYDAFRAELEPIEQLWFDELLCRARRHGNAINRHPVLDFERPVILAMLLEGMRVMEDQARQATLLRQELGELRRDMEAALNDLQPGLALRRLPPPPPVELGRLGQTRLTDHAAGSPVSA